MDFMNLNQAAHGDREHGFIAARLRMPRKIIAGYWQDEEIQKRLGRWMRTAVGVAVSRELKVMRFATTCARWPSPRATRWKSRPSWAGR